MAGKLETLYTGSLLLRDKAFCHIMASIRNDSMDCLISLGGEAVIQCSCQQKDSDRNRVKWGGLAPFEKMCRG